MTRVVTVVGLWLATLLLAACDLIGGDTQLGQRITLVNDTDDAVEVFSLRDGVESRLAPIAPGETFTIAASQYEDRCLPDPIRARRSDGTLVSARDDRLCSSDVWRITAESGPSASG